MHINTTRALAVGAAVTALGLAAAPAFAADAPAPATAQGWQLDYTVHEKTPATTTESGKVFSSQDGAVSGAPLVGLTKSGRVNISTGLYYPSVTAFDPSNPYAGTAKVSIAAPVVGIAGATVGAVPLTTSATDLKVACVSDDAGNATGSVNVSGTVPVGNAGLVSPNTTVYLPKGSGAKRYQMKVVYNEQTRLANGQLQVVGMHVYFDVPSTGLLGSEAVTGDVRLGVATCGKVTNAAEGDVPIASAGVAGGAFGLSALVGGGVAAVRRRRTN